MPKSRHTDPILLDQEHLTKRDVDELLDIKEEYESVEYAEQQLQKLGLPLPKKPKLAEKYTQLPDNITEVPDEELGEYLLGFSALQGYAEYQSAKTEAERAIAERILRITHAIGYLSETGKVTERRILRDIRKDVATAETVYSKKEALANMTKAIFDSYGINASAISRVISLRTGLRDTESTGYGKRAFRK